MAWGMASGAPPDACAPDLARSGAFQKRESWKIPPRLTFPGYACARAFDTKVPIMLRPGFPSPGIPEVVSLRFMRPCVPWHGVSRRGREARRPVPGCVTRDPCHRALYPGASWARRCKTDRPHPSAALAWPRPLPPPAVFRLGPICPTLKRPAGAVSGVFLRAPVPLRKGMDPGPCRRRGDHPRCRQSLQDAIENPI